MPVSLLCLFSLSTLLAGSTQRVNGIVTAEDNHMQTFKVEAKGAPSASDLTSIYESCTSSDADGDTTTLYFNLIHSHAVSKIASRDENLVRVNGSLEWLQ